MMTPKAIISDNLIFLPFGIKVKFNNLYYNNKINYKIYYRIYVKDLSIYMCLCIIDI